MIQLSSLPVSDCYAVKDLTNILYLINSTDPLRFVDIVCVRGV